MNDGGRHTVILKDQKVGDDAGNGGPESSTHAGILIIWGDTVSLFKLMQFGKRHEQVVQFTVATTGSERRVVAPKTSTACQ